MTIHVLAVPGSLRHGGFTTALLQRYVTLLEGAVPAHGVVVTWSGHIAALPAYNADLDTASPPTDVVEARLSIASADAVVISTPQYNGSIPGGLKNWLDWMTRPFGRHPLVGMPVAVIGGSPSSGGASKAVDWLHMTLGLLGAITTPEPLAVPCLDQELAASDTLEITLARHVDELAALLQPVVTRK
jgi:chromate reductase